MKRDDLWKQLARLEEEEILSAADIAFSRFLEERDREAPPEVLLAGCLVSYYFRQGNVCLPLEEVAGRPLFEESKNGVRLKGPGLAGWVDKLARSPLTGRPGAFKPLILDAANRLYLHKLWNYEQSLAQDITERSQRSRVIKDKAFFTGILSRLFDDTPEGETDWQKVATVAAALNRFTIISGGPGTGKTSTVVRMLALLLELEKNETGRFPSIALAAPTGKAAARLNDSILSMKESLSVSEEVREAIPAEASTLHQLLGARRHSSVFRHNRENPLPYDLIIVDEASMIDQALMSKLMEALLGHTRLILLGDKDQLASVEAGSVMGDLCAIDENRLSPEFAAQLNRLSIPVPSLCVSEEGEILTDHIVLLTKSYRFKGDSGIARLAGAVNGGRAEEALEVLESGRYPEASFMQEGETEHFVQRLEHMVADYFEQIISAATPEEAFRVFNTFRILSAHRRGPKGVEYLNQMIEHMLHHRGFIAGHQTWYPGKPVIINQNDYSLNLYNGDTGLCLPDTDGTLKVHVSQEGVIRSLAPARLPDHSLAYAMTVHKSQGSEFDRVLLILPDQPSRILTRELIYTAITRARSEVIVGGSPSILAEGIQARLRRTSGLRDHLWKTDTPVE